jgi:hypothetical protein
VGVAVGLDAGTNDTPVLRTTYHSSNGPQCMYDDTDKYEVSLGNEKFLATVELSWAVQVIKPSIS